LVPSSFHAVYQAFPRVRQYRLFDDRPAHRRELHSFPTRRSSDLTALAEQSREIWRQWNMKFGVELYHEIGFLFMRQRPIQKKKRSEEHTSELQSLAYLVCRLLLEKKK